VAPRLKLVLSLLIYNKLSIQRPLWRENLVTMLYRIHPTCNSVFRTFDSEDKYFNTMGVCSLSDWYESQAFMIRGYSFYLSGLFS